MANRFHSAARCGTSAHRTTAQYSRRSLRSTVQVNGDRHAGELRGIKRLYRRMWNNAAKPSRHVIFFPSAYVRPLYEIGISQMRARACAKRAVISTSNPKRLDESGKRLTSSGRTNL